MTAGSSSADTMAAMIYAVCILIGAVLAAAVAAAAGVVLLRVAVRQNLPSFCAGRWPTSLAVPVVMYHAVDRRWLAGELQYLKDNGYETISADALVDALEGRAVELPKRPIVITFDDGHRSLYTDAWPLLRSFRFQAISFICPWWVREDDGSADQPLDDHAHPMGRCATWAELREMSDAGVIDVQAHTFAHQQIWVDGVVRGFVTPSEPSRYVAWERFDDPPSAPNPPLGWPVLTHASRFSHRRRFLPELTPMRACAEHVQANGGSSFFSRPDWQHELSDLLCAQPGVHCAGEQIILPGTLETPEQRADALRRDLQQTREIIESKLGREVRHLCFPWNEGDLDATRIARECGFRSGFRRTINGRDVCQVHDEPMYIVRFKSDVSQQAVRCLPGRHRRGPVGLLMRSVAASVARRIGRGGATRSTY